MNSLSPAINAANKMDVAPKPRMVAIASGKGGDGKTWLSLALAQALVQRRAKVLLLNADPGPAHADIQPDHRAEHDLANLMHGETMAANTIKPVKPGGFDVLAGRSGSGALAGLDSRSADTLVAELRAATSYDVIILDLSAGLDDMVRRILAFCDTVLLVITEDPASLTDAYAVLKLLKIDRSKSKAEIDARIIVNQASSAEAGKRAHAALSRAARRFLRLDPPLLGVINRNEHVANATHQQKLLPAQFPDAKAGLEVQAIARRLSMKPCSPRA